MSTHNENGIWSQETAEAHHQSSPKLAAWLASYLSKDTPVIDFGCGIGYYVDTLQKNGFEAHGVEGTNLKFLCHIDSIVIMDLTNEIYFGFQSSVISLEVGEHLPASAQETFMQTLVNHCSKHLILSWAEIGQPGIGHINCRSQEDVIQDVESRGFKLNAEATADARANIDDNTDWFRRTLLVFERV
jgi:tryptophanyl-tRNA synthetase